MDDLNMRNECFQKDESFREVFSSILKKKRLTHLEKRKNDLKKKKEHNKKEKNNMF